MVSLTVLNIEKIKNGTIFKKDDFSFEELQSKLDTFGCEKVRGLGEHKTSIKKAFEEGNFIKYDVRMSSDTIKEPIYIHDYEEWINGYQKIERFDVWLESSLSQLFVFAPKHAADLFSARLKKSGFMICSKITFDFSKIGELANLDSAWGFWEDGQGIVRKIAKFGKGINNTIINYSKITTLYIDYNHRDEIIQLILGSDGRVGTNRNISNAELSGIYSDISKVLVKKT